MPYKPGFDHGDNGRERKRSKRQHHSVVDEAEIGARTAGPETALEVDFLILDHLAYKATVTIFRASDAVVQRGKSMVGDTTKSADLEQCLSSFQSWFQYFISRWSVVRVDAQMRVRLLLLRFMTLYHQRLTLSNSTPSPAELEALRDMNDQRAKNWIKCAERVPTYGDMDHFSEYFLAEGAISEADRKAHCRHVLGLFHENQDSVSINFYGSGRCISLLDVLPLFLQLGGTASTAQLIHADADYLRLCVDFIRQACIEQYLARGETNLDAMDQAFSWGCYAEPPCRESDREAWEIDRIFRSEANVHEEVQLWQDLRHEALHELLAPLEDETKQQRFARLARKHPVLTFDAALRMTMASLETQIPLPILAQVERGRLDGKTREETAALLRQWDVDLESVLR